MHNLKHAQIDRRILFRALKLLEETVAAHPFFEEASQHAVLSPDTAVLVRQIFHDVIGAGGKRIFRGFNLVGRSVGRARIDLELLKGLRDLIHQLVWVGAGERRPQAPKQQQKRGRSAHQGIRRERDESRRRVRRQSGGRPARRSFAGIEVPRARNPGLLVPVSRLLAQRRGGERGRGSGERRRRLNARRSGGVGSSRERRRATSGGVGTNDGSVATTKRVIFVRRHRRFSVTAENSLYSCLQQPTKRKPMALVSRDSSRLFAGGH